MKQLPSRLRQMIFRQCFSNQVLQNDFTKNKRLNQINSQHENHIVKVENEYTIF